MLIVEEKILEVYLEEDDKKMQSLQRLCHQLAKEKGFWDEKQRNKGELLMLVVSELGEALEALRKGNRQKLGEEWRKDTFEDELADAIIRLLDLVESENVDMNWQIFNKLDYNKTREHKHGKKF